MKMMDAHRTTCRVIYGAPHQLKLLSEPGQGTLARVEIPEIVTTDRATA